MAKRTYHIISGAYVALERATRSRLSAGRILQSTVVAQFRRLIVVNLKQELSIGVHRRWHVVSIVSASAVASCQISISAATTPSSTSTRLLSLLHVIIVAAVIAPAWPCGGRVRSWELFVESRISLGVTSSSLAIHVVVVVIIIVVVIGGGFTC